MNNSYIITGVILIILVAGIVGYVMYDEGMTYSRNPFPKLNLDAGTEKDCSSPCSCVPEGVTCDKESQYCFRKGKFFDRGQYCGEICRGCGDMTSYKVSQPAIPAHSVDVTLAKSPSLPFTSPLGTGRPPMVYPYNF